MTKLAPSALAPQYCWRGLVCIALCLVLTACGFRLKGVSPLPFDTLYTNINENSEFGSNLLRAIAASSPGIRFVDTPADAEARLTQLQNNRSLRELSINAEGQVEEYELNLVFTFQLTDNQGRIVLPPTVLRSTRELPYDPTVVQAKEGEITMVFREMQQSLVSQIVRRLSSPEVNTAFENAESLPVDESLLAPPAESTTDATTSVPKMGPMSPRSAPQINLDGSSY
ncbi:LPS assembly lipoprotein LptE [Pollutimonas harenae]|nr:LPS assembly lipoprotein LptE [Pollutimonas harenae]